MSRHQATIEWALRAGEDFLAGSYSREHRLRFDGGVVVPGSASPSIVSAPWSNAAAADPEELLVAALSACHMLWFLDLAHRSNILVKSYFDTAEGRMGRDAAGRLYVAECVLRPQVEANCATEQLDDLHHKAHGACFIANSVLTKIRIEPLAYHSGTSDAA